MATQMSEFIAVRKSDLEKMPKGFQGWVKKYFRKTKIFGEPCYAAFTTSGLVSYQEDLVGTGAALDWLGPTEYTEGLPRGKRLMSWLRGSRKQEVFIFDADWDDGNISSID